jgi:hypothetical protein
VLALKGLRGIQDVIQHGGFLVAAADTLTMPAESVTRMTSRLQIHDCPWRGTASLLSGILHSPVIKPSCKSGIVLAGHTQDASANTVADNGYATWAISPVR